MHVVLAGNSSRPGSEVEHAPLLAALSALGVRGETVSWDDAAYDWSRPAMVVLRSTWDYHLRREAFLRWIDRVAAETVLWNPARVVHWNTHKRYLVELGEGGVPVVPTVLVPAGEPVDLRVVAGDRGWGEVVVKPAVSAGAHRTMRVRASALDAGDAHLHALTATGDALVQPYLPSVEGSGERSLVFVDGAFSHAVRRAPALVDGADPDDATPAEAAPDELAAALAALARVESELLYARVDLARDGEGRAVLMELELVEPTLFLQHGEGAAARLAAGIARRLRAIKDSRS